MSDLERILKLASHGTADARSQAPAERELKDVPVVAEDDSQDRQLEAWCKKWSKYKGMNGDPLPLGWVLSKVDSGITTDGIEAGEADKAMEIIYPGKGAEVKSDMNKGDAYAYNVDWGDFEIQKHLPITNAMQDEFIAIMGDDDESTMQDVYDIVKSACMETTTEAVGEFAEPIYDLIDMHFEGDCQPVFDDLVRYLSGDQIEDFVADFRRNHDLPMGDDMDEAYKKKTKLNASEYKCEDCGDTMHKPTTDCSHDSHDETGDWWKDKNGNGVPDSLEEAPNEGNEFSGALAQAKKDGKKEFEVDGKKYKVEDAQKGPFVKQGGNQTVTISPKAKIKTKTGGSKVESAPVGEENINELNVPNDKEEVKSRIEKLMKMADDARDAGDSNKAYSIERSSEMAALQNKLSKLGGDDNWVTPEGGPLSYKKVGEYTYIVKDENGKEHKAEMGAMGDEQDNYSGDEIEQTMDQEGLAMLIRQAEMGAPTEEISEAPTIDTTQLITLLKNAGLSEEKIKTKLDEWANTPAGAAEEEATSHGEPYENFAQSVNLSLKRYLDAEDMKVGLKEHKVEDIKEAYKKSKEK